MARSASADCDLLGGVGVSVGDLQITTDSYFPSKFHVKNLSKYRIRLTCSTYDDVVLPAEGEAWIPNGAWVARIERADPS